MKILNRKKQQELIEKIIRIQESISKLSLYADLALYNHKYINTTCEWHDASNALMDVLYELDPNSLPESSEIWKRFSYATYDCFISESYTEKGDKDENCV